ncbi:MAG TPA: extracellular solute-binding protein [Acidimicrobiia bacterium]|nr:extracellular solute-binding protein [Acidimicrobiia bacterium]
MKRTPKLLSLLAVLVLVLAACGGGEGGEASTTAAPDTSPTTAAPDEATTTAAPDDEMEPVTIEWWHIQNTDPMMTVWQTFADEFMAANPHVTVNITVMENEAFKAALQTNLQAGDVPDLFQSWGGGGLREQVEAGLVQDITDASSGFVGNLSEGAVGLYQVDGVQYGIPFNLGMVGFWYNQDLFAEAGIDAPPETWDEFLEDVQTLKDAGITPIAVGAGDKWPAHFYYSYLMIRMGGEDAMNQVAEDLDFNKPEFVEAGNQLQRLIDLEPFQPGFLAAPWDAPDGESGTIGTGQAAISLMGQWGPGAYANQSGIGTPEDSIADRLPGEFGWFPFPAVEGGAGAATDGFGGGDGFAVGKDAPPEAVQFLEYITSLDQAIRTGETGTTLPVTKGAEVSITDPYQLAVLEGLSNASFVQLYLDQFFTPELGAAVNDAVATLFAGTATPEEVTEAITAAAG